eukprot:CAMPEP_0172011732 /NCGR_PEP_ID=MMETSP1041-20130122/8444_1 /TAXON_ID=464988 /ORGANISM="Hemiselmis andersenii, Strain CCMP439" /LENGTH=220 /DNA_ID=CAMNT_0012666227 /DNA_START=332 /DNA_END=996 /DNA_ORIENTATION=+
MRSAAGSGRRCEAPVALIGPDAPKPLQRGDCVVHIIPTAVGVLNRLLPAVPKVLGPRILQRLANHDKVVVYVVRRRLRPPLPVPGVDDGAHLRALVVSAVHLNVVHQRPKQCFCLCGCLGLAPDVEKDEVMEESNDVGFELPQVLLAFSLLEKAFDAEKVVGKMQPAAKMVNSTLNEMLSIFSDTMKMDSTVKSPMNRVCQLPMKARPRPNNFHASTNST